MYKISAFSKKTGISTATLRYYDQINFLKPSYVDFFSGYRYYLDEQVDYVKKINKLKGIGLSLEEIKEFMEKQDINILKEKRKELENVMEKIDRILNEKQEKYIIIEGNYKKYVELNGTKQADCPQALEIRDNNAYYYIINKNDKFFLDFCIYKKDNWITLDKRYILDKNIMKVIKKEIAKYMEDITFFVPLNDLYCPTKIDTYLEKLSEMYKYDSEDIKQGSCDYKKITINLDNI